MIKIQSKILAAIIILFVMFVYGSQFYGTIAGKKYYKEFITDEFIKLEIKITNCYSAEEPTIIEIVDQEEIAYYGKFISESLKSGSIKEQRLYYYNVQLKFTNKSNTNLFFYEVFLDNEDMLSRPVILREKGRNSWPGGYPFVLNDSNLFFYNKILQMINSK